MDVDLMSYQRASKADFGTILRRPKRDRSAQFELRRLQQQRHCGTNLESAGITPARSFVVETARQSVRKVAADRDIFFHCQHCKAALVANRSAAGMTLTCQKCGQLTPVPKVEEPSASALAYAEEIRGKLTENESQRAEITGNINQLTIQLHRWQLRLQTLNERKQQLEKELSGK